MIATFDTKFLTQLTTFNSAIKRDTISSVSFLTGSEKTEKIGTLSSGIEVYYSIDDNGLYELDFVANKIFAPVSCISLFTRFENLILLNFSNFDTCNVTDMSYMFYNCVSLTTLDLSNFDTGNVTDMSYMFNNCRALITLDLSNFDTRSVTSSSDMYYNCSVLTEIIVGENYTLDNLPTAA